MVPAPNWFTVKGTNEEQAWASGQQFEIAVAGLHGDGVQGVPCTGGWTGGLNLDASQKPFSLTKDTYDSVPSVDYVEIQMGSWWPGSATPPDERKCIGMGLYAGGSRVGSPSGQFIETGEQVRVEWTASSGGKGTTLFQYTVQ
jgi:hypothetical protein